MTVKDTDYVWSVQVRKIDPPQFIAEWGDDLDDLTANGAVTHGLEQCDGCGNPAYALVRDGKTFYAVCTEDPDDEVSHQFGGCGARYRVFLERAALVQF